VLQRHRDSGAGRRLWLLRGALGPWQRRHDHVAAVVARPHSSPRRAAAHGHALQASARQYIPAAAAWQLRAGGMLLASTLMAAPSSKPLLSVCIPARNEEQNITRSIDTIHAELQGAGVPHEFVIANDNSTDGTERVVREKMVQGCPIRLINRRPPGGFGRAIRSCLDHFRGDIVVVVMADLSDDPKDIVRYYDKINEGFDAVFGSRFLKGSVVKDYPRIKLVANRLGNKLIQLLFWTSHNDMTNAFKAYRGDAIRSLLPLYASHFNLTIEISLGLLIRGFRVASMPINWYGRTWGSAKFNIRTLGRRYFATIVKAWAERCFIHDDLMVEHGKKLDHIHRVAGVEDEVFTNISDEEDSDHRRGGIRRLEPRSPVQAESAGG
jgi:dolichol-phosphate mannosyltransferase